MNRRKFLHHGAAAAAALAATTIGGNGARDRLRAAETNETPGAAASAIAGRQPGAKLQLSCAAYSFRNQLGGKEPSLSLEGFVDFCAQQGLEATELTSYYFRDTSPEFLYRLRRRAYVNGLAISGTPVGNNFCLPPGAERDEQIGHVKTWIDHVAKLGSQTIRVFSGGVPAGSSEAEARGWAVECFKECAGYAGRHGVLLGLENHGGISTTADQLLAIIRRVDSPWLGINLDTGNFKSSTPYEEMEKAAPYAVSVQVKVALTVAGKRQETDLGRVAGILRQAGYRGYVALEYEEKVDPMAAVPRYLEKLRQAIG